jgi:hypothetical protein
MSSHLIKWTFAMLLIGVAGEVDAQTIIPPDRNFPWNPGMMSRGGPSGAGIPTNRTQCGAVLSPSGGDDSAATQAAVNACPAGQMIMLGPGTFIINRFILINKGITLRGAGPGVRRRTAHPLGQARLCLGPSPQEARSITTFMRQLHTPPLTYSQLSSSGRQDGLNRTAARLSAQFR